MALREQKVEIGFSRTVHSRVVYDVRNHEALKFQTGHVEFNNHLIPVWRPMNPDDKSLHAKWRGGSWENIYVVRMHQMKDSQYRRSEFADLVMNDHKLQLPKVSVEIMGSFKAYLLAQMEQTISQD